MSISMTCSVSRMIVITTMICFSLALVGILFIESNCIVRR
jgi:hypothetical protein